MALTYRQKLLETIPADTREFYEQSTEGIEERLKNTRVRVESLFLSPIKSLKAMPVSRLEITERGGKIPHSDLRDRMLMLMRHAPRKIKNGQHVDAEYFNQAHFPALSHIRQAFDSRTNSLCISVEGVNIAPLSIPLLQIIGKYTEDGDIKKVKMKGADEVLPVLYENGELTEWFQVALKELGYPADQTHAIQIGIPPRSLEREADNPFEKSRTAQTIYSDGAQLSLASSRTLEWLLRQSDTNLLIESFRPNIVLGSAEGSVLPAHAEDYIEVLESLGSGRWLQLCLEALTVRCPVVEVDQEKGAREKGVLKVLSELRPRRPDGDKRVTFGVNAVLGENSPKKVLQVGDELMVRTLKV